MSSPDHSYDSFAFDPYDQWDPYDGSRQTLADELKLCQLPDWDSERTYDDDPPIYIYYSIEWKVTMNNRATMRLDTEQDIVLALLPTGNTSSSPSWRIFCAKKRDQSSPRIQMLWFRSQSAKSVILQNDLMTLFCKRLYLGRSRDK